MITGSSPQLSECVHFRERTSVKIWKETQHTAHISSCFIYGTLGHSGRFHRFQVILDAYLHFTINFNIKMGVYFFLFFKDLFREYISDYHFFLWYVWYCFCHHLYSIDSLVFSLVCRIFISVEQGCENIESLLTTAKQHRHIWTFLGVFT